MDSFVLLLLYIILFFFFYVMYDKTCFCATAASIANEEKEATMKTKKKRKRTKYCLRMHILLTAADTILINLNVTHKKAGYVNKICVRCSTATAKHVEYWLYALKSLTFQRFKFHIVITHSSTQPCVIVSSFCASNAKQLTLSFIFFFLCRYTHSHTLSLFLSLILSQNR